MYKFNRNQIFGTKPADSTDEMAQINAWLLGFFSQIHNLVG